MLVIGCVSMSSDPFQSIENSNEIFPGIPEIQDKKVDTRERLISVAKKLFSEKGFDGTTVKDIADAAHVNVSLVSYHFSGKEGLYRTCLEQHGRIRLAIAERLLVPPSSLEELRIRLTLLLEEMIHAHLEEPEVSKIIMRECESQSPFMQDIFKDTFLKVYETLVRFLQVAQERELVKREITPEIAAGLIFGAFMHVIQKDKLNETFFGKTIRDPNYRENVIRQSVSFFFNGFAQNEIPCFEMRDSSKVPLENSRGNK